MIFQYFKGDELSEYEKVSDREINVLFQELRKIAPEFYIKEIKVVQRKFFRTKAYFLYTCYLSQDRSEAQVVNFIQESEWSLNTAVRKSYIVTYLLGILCGIKLNEEKSKS